MISLKSIDHAEQLVRDGSSIKNAASEIGCGPDALSKLLRRRGVDTSIGKGHTPHNRKDLDCESIIADYLSGESEKALAEKYGISRNVIRGRLLEKGVEPRGRRDAMLIRMGKLSRKERKQLTSAAHDAVRGRPQTHERKLRRAQRAQENIGYTLIGHGEDFLANVMIERGVRFVRQAAIGIYNTDFLVGSVAVELTSDPGLSHRRRENFERRVKYISDQNILLLYLVFPSEIGLSACLEDFFSNLEAADSNPTVFGEYWVMRCGRDRGPIVRDERGQFSPVGTSEKFYSTLSRFYV